MNEKMLKCITLFLIGLSVGTIFNTPAWALEWRDIRVFIPPGTLVIPTQQYSKTFSLDTTGVTFETCHNQSYYSLGSCDYLYKCYIILPEDCSEVSCAVNKGCTEILSLQNPETVSVSYTPSATEVNKKYGVAAFVLKSHMTYNWTTTTWSDYTTMVESTKQADIIEIQGAPTPPAVNPIEKLSLLISNIISSIKSWLCTNLGAWC